MGRNNAEHLCAVLPATAAGIEDTVFCCLPYSNNILSTMVLQCLRAVPVHAAQPKNVLALQQL